MTITATQSNMEISKKLKDYKDEVKQITARISEQNPIESAQELEKRLDDIELVVQSEKDMIDFEDLAAIIESIKTALAEMRKHMTKQDIEIENLKRRVAELEQMETKCMDKSSANQKIVL